MKIIAATKDGFLLEADKHEVARLAGYYWPGDDDARRDGFRFEVGADIPISKMYERLRHLAAAPIELEGAAKTLRAVAELLGPVKRLIGAVDGPAAEAAK